MRIRKEFHMGEMVEWWWGVAYPDPMRRVIIAYIIPINWVVWIVREIWIRLRIPPYDSLSDKLQESYIKGWEDCKKHYE